MSTVMHFTCNLHQKLKYTLLLRAASGCRGSGYQSLAAKAFPFFCCLCPLPWHAFTLLNQAFQLGRNSIAVKPINGHCVLYTKVCNTESGSQHRLQILCPARQLIGVTITGYKTSLRPTAFPYQYRELGIGFLQVLVLAQDKISAEALPSHQHIPLHI